MRPPRASSLALCLPTLAAAVSLMSACDDRNPDDNIRTASDAADIGPDRDGGTSPGSDGGRGAGDEGGTGPGNDGSTDPETGPDTSLAAGADIAGTWLGILATDGFSFHVVFNVNRVAEGNYTATIDSPEQEAFAIPASRASLTDCHVELAVAAASILFTGELSPDGQEIAGTFSQGPFSQPLTLRKQPGRLDYRRPQDPAMPYPYNSAEVMVPSRTAGVRLACTLTWPQGPGPFRAAVLITGSGPQNRNEQLLNHRPFLVLSDALARQGIAALRCDDRGVGGSTGDHDAATSRDFAEDVRGAVTFLRSAPQFPVAGVGLVGHSEGGLIAPLVADGNPDIAFLVLLAGPGVTGAEIIVSQQRAIAAAEGESPAVLDEEEADSRAILALFTPDADPAELDRKLRQLLTAQGVAGQELEMAVASLNTPWMRFFIPYDPRPVLRRTTIPTLALNGARDLQVLPDLNLPPIQAALAEAGNTRVTARILPELNHLFQHASTGLPSEYSLIDETFSPAVLALISGWINAVP